MTTDTKTEGALAAVEELRVDSKIGKSKHFNASDRKLFWHRICGVPVILANLFVGIVLVSLQGQGGSQSPAEIKSLAPISSPKQGSDPKLELTSASRPADSPQVFKSQAVALLSILLAFGAASLSAVQTFFNFHKASEGHRAIGNRYTHVSRKCKAIQQRHRDIPYSSQEIWHEYNNLYDEYHQINTEAEAFPTNTKDLKQAKTVNRISPYMNPHSAANKT